MQVMIWIIIIVITILIIRLLRRWIKRLIFIAILLILAFFIYWIFSPSGAGKLWYNIRTFPQRITSWISDKNFLDYESYKSSLSEIWDNIKSNLTDDDIIEDSDEKADEENNLEPEDNSEKWKIETSTDNNGSENNNQPIKRFPKITKFPDFPKSLNVKKTNTVVTWYSKSDVLWIINWYIENNLDDDTDILVTVEYEDDYNDPEKIILQTQPRID